MKKLLLSLTLFCSLTRPGLAQHGPVKLFTLLNPRETGLQFTNRLVENDSLHIMNYEYLYNGNGLGVADFNQDGLTDLFISSNTGSYKLYLNEGGFRFSDITSRANVKGNGTWATGVSIADVNGDGLPDIYVCHSGKYPAQKLVNELFIHQGIRNGRPVFREMAREYGLDAPGTQSTQAAFLDYDRDGDLDMFLLNHSNHTYNPLLNTRKIRSTFSKEFGNRLFRNDGAAGKPKFTEVTREAGIVNNALNFGLSVTVSDLNKDGWPDIFTTSDYTEQDYLYINNRDGTFREQIRSAVDHTSKFSMGADIADFNNDLLPDIVTLDMLPADNHRQKMLKGPDEYDTYNLLVDSGYFHQQMRNMLQLNQGVAPDGVPRFSEIGQLAGISATDWSWAPLLADFDNDGWKDLFVSNGYLRDFTDMDFLKYTVANAQSEALKSGTVKFRTYDLVKKMPSNKLNNYVFRNNGDLTFTDNTRAWGLEHAAVSNSSVYADLDNDGDLDLIVNNLNEPLAVYRNNAEKSGNRSIRIRLIGAGGNTAALGAKVYLETSGGTQYQEMYPVRGYQASTDPVLLFGTGTAEVTGLKVAWPGGRQTSIKKVGTGLLTLREADATEDPAPEKKTKPVFADITGRSNLPYRHTENEFIDFKGEPLMPYQLSRMGPAVAAADVNGDGHPDVYLGGAIGQSGQLFLGKADGSFQPAAARPWERDAASEDVNALFFDANGDGHPDLWVVSGGNEYDDGAPEYQDRLYLGDGRGNFTRLEKGLPDMFSSKQAIAVSDMDGDGDADLFIGGMGQPGSFPLAARSYLLRNDSDASGVRFTDVTAELAPALLNPGMVTSAVWVGLRQDQFPDLVIAGHWMPVRIFSNNKGRLTDISDRSGLKQTDGLWSALVPADVNGDGSVDLIAGNAGLNSQHKTTQAEPMAIYGADFNGDGALDPILTYYIQGKNHPYASRDELLDQIVQMRKRFIRYADYADITTDQLFPKEQLEKATTVYCYELASGVFENDGNGNFSFKPFPVAAQFSAVYGILHDDYDGDGRKDILLAGNFYPYRVQAGRSDAGKGLVLKGLGSGKYEPLTPRDSGFYAPGDVRGMVSLQDKTGKKRIIVVRNNDSVNVIKVK